MKEQMTMKKSELRQFLLEREKWFIDYANPFQEATMVNYINNGLKSLNELNCSDDTLVKMYDLNNELVFEVA